MADVLEIWSIQYCQIIPTNAHTKEHISISNYFVIESSSSIEEDKDEVQITAAVVDLRGSCDIEEEVIGNEEEDYSSYELDESDNVIGINNFTFKHGAW